MALLKESVDATLSFDAEMFPDLLKKVDTVIDASISRKASGCASLTDTEILDVLGLGYSFFTVDERTTIKAKIREYDANHKSRSGGSELLKCLQHIQTAKESLDKNIAAIRDILQPKVVSRTTLAEATALAEQASIKRVAATFVSLPEKMLRSFAEMVVGDAQIEYTVDELPLLIATKQISGVILTPGKVL